MGFLLGKLSDTLSEFETTNQDSEHDDGLLTERSINRSLTSYSFREKGSWSYEFQYMTDTDFRNLIYLLKNRNSLKEGMMLLPIPYSHTPNSCILLPTYNSTNKCYFGEVTGNYPWNVVYDSLFKTELTEAMYTKVRVNDTNYVYLESDPDYTEYFLLQFDLSAFINSFSYQEIRRLTIAMMGMNSSPYRFFIWSPLRSDWYLMDDRYYQDSTAFDSPSGSGAFSLNKGLVSSFSLPWGSDSIKNDFLDANNLVKFMICGKGVSQSIMIQFIRLFVNGYWVTNGQNQKIENFSTNFTGAGRSGNLYLTEL